MSPLFVEWWGPIAMVYVFQFIGAAYVYCVAIRRDALAAFGNRIHRRMIGVEGCDGASGHPPVDTIYGDWIGSHPSHFPCGVTAQQFGEAVTVLGLSPISIKRGGSPFLEAGISIGAD